MEHFYNAPTSFQLAVSDALVSASRDLAAVPGPESLGPGFTCASVPRPARQHAHCDATHGGVAWTCPGWARPGEPDLLSPRICRSHARACARKHMTSGQCWSCIQFIDSSGRNLLMARVLTTTGAESSSQTNISGLICSPTLQALAVTRSARRRQPAKLPSSKQRRLEAPARCACTCAP